MLDGSNEVRRYHLHESHVQKAIKKAVQKTQIGFCRMPKSRKGTGKRHSRNLEKTPSPNKQRCYNDF